MSVIHSMRSRLAAGTAIARSAHVLLGSGLVEFGRPDHMLAAYHDIRTFGPVATPVRVGARRHPHTVAVIDESRSITYRALDESTDRLAVALRADGYGSGTVVGTLCRDHVRLVQVMVAAGKLGARLVLLNTSMSARQTAEVCIREGVTLLMYDAEFDSVIEHVPAVERIVVDTGVDELIDSSPKGRTPVRPRSPGTLVLLTGGTTGVPKGAQRKVTSPFGAAQLLDRIPLPVGGTTFFAAPMFHGTGLSLFLLSLSLGSTNILARKFDPEEVLRQIESRKVTTLVLVPTMMHRILLCKKSIESRDTSSLRIIFSAGSAIPISVGNEAIARFGPVLYNLYGSSEVGVVAVAQPKDWIAAPGTAGRPPASVTVRLYDSDDKPVIKANRTGTVFAGSGLSFDGYTGGGTKKAIDGLLSTGDVGHWDAAGRLHIDGRDDDMIVSGGENVFSGEVEDLLYAHSAISEAAVLGVADEEFGQRLAAAIVLGPDQKLAADEVKAYVKANLARYKVPRDVWFVDTLPRTASGKLLRRNLVEMFSASDSELGPVSS